MRRFADGQVRVVCREFAGEFMLAAQGAEAAGGDITPERRHFAALLYFILVKTPRMRVAHASDALC